MNHEVRAGLEKPLESAGSLRLPPAWLQEMPNHTVAVLLADILSSYLAIGDASDQRPALIEGNELLLEYKRLARRLRLSTRSVSRGIDHLVHLKALHYSRRDRTINDRLTRNVVGVVPNLRVISRISGLAYGDILSGPRAARPASRAASPPRSQLAQAPAPAHEPVPLTDFQESFVGTFQRYFQETFGLPYRPSPDQRQADLRAAALVACGKARGGGRKYMVWAQQYLNALKDQAEQEHGDVQQAIVGRNGFVRPAFTLERFLDWVHSEDPLPNGFERRRM